ncbi:HAD hydrolase subfamily IA REG-2-like protein [Amylocystis lapponica]|nr:HAD hydrolase subfamily IA REG-2-like protein [Amylocystis lapponica]
MAIRLVLFDAFSTLLTPRLPVYVQYSETFEPYLGVLEPDALKRSFKIALKQLQAEKPAYQSGAQEWWGEVIRRTAVGAGGDPNAVDKSLAEIVPRLLKRFSSREGYRAFDDSILALRQLKESSIHTGLVSNTDTRMREVLADLEVLPHLDVVLLSEEERIEKPSRDIFMRACARVGVKPEEAVHVGDEIKGDYFGAKDSGLNALLVRRPGADGESEMKEPDEDLTTIDTVPSLLHVVEWVRRRNIGGAA